MKYKILLSSLEHLPGSTEHLREFTEILLSSKQDGILYLQSISDRKGSVIDYIIRYYNKAIQDAFHSIGITTLQPGVLLFELFPGLKKNVTFFRQERLLRDRDHIEFFQYFDTDSLDHWLSIRVTKYLDNGYILDISDKTNETKEKLWSELNLKVSELLLKNHYWRLAVAPILKKILEVSKASRVNFYFNEENDPNLEFQLLDSWLVNQEILDEDEEKLRQAISFSTEELNDRESAYSILKNNRILIWQKSKLAPSTALNQIMKDKRVFRSVLVPIVLFNELLGIIELENPKGALLYSRERRVLNSISESFSAAILRRFTRKKVEESQIYYKSLVEKLNVIVFKRSISSDFSFTYLSPEVLQLTGFTSEEILADYGKYIDQILPEERSLVDESVSAAIKQNASYEIEYQIECKNHFIKWLRESASPIHDDFGNPLEYLGHITDITEQKKKEAEVIQTKKLESIGRFTGGIAHDLNNMIQPAMIYLSLIREVLEGKQEFAHILPKLDKAYSSLIRCRELIKKIIDFSRTRSPNDEKSLLIQCLRLSIEGFQKQHSIPVRLVHPERIPVEYKLPVDSDSLVQVFSNILENSAEAMKDREPKLLEIEFDSDSIHYILKIKDSGKGIKESILSSVFDPFFTTKEVGSGSGLGLSIVYGILKNLSGQVTIENYTSNMEDGTEISGVIVTLRFPKECN